MTRQEIIKELYDLQDATNELHAQFETKEVEVLIEKAYKAIDEAIRCLEA